MASHTCEYQGGPDRLLLTDRDGSEEQDLTHREQQLWHRQEALWQQQLAHWQHERDSFIQREQALLAHIQQLHSHLTALATAHMQSNRTAGFINDDFDDVPVTASGEDRQATLAVAEMLANTASRDQQTAAEPPSSATNSSETTSVPLTGVLSKEPAPVPAPAGQESSSASPTALTPQGPPPPLRLGSDDIYWVHQLQAGLMAEGYYCGEEEMEDFIFESGTESAVLAFQVRKNCHLSCCLSPPLQTPANNICFPQLVLKRHCITLLFVGSLRLHSWPKSVCCTAFDTGMCTSRLFMLTQILVTIICPLVIRTDSHFICFSVCWQVYWPIAQTDIATFKI